jgi:hypothetical protein
MYERIAFETAILKLEAASRSMPERRPETFEDYVPLQEDFASLLRERAEVSPAPLSAEERRIISPALLGLVAPPQTGRAVCAAIISSSWHPARSTKATFGSPTCFPRTKPVHQRQITATNLSGPFELITLTV